MPISSPSDYEDAKAHMADPSLPGEVKAQLQSKMDDYIASVTSVAHDPTPAPATDPTLSAVMQQPDPFPAPHGVDLSKARALPSIQATPPRIEGRRTGLGIAHSLPSHLGGDVEQFVDPSFQEFLRQKGPGLAGDAETFNAIRSAGTASPEYQAFADEKWNQVASEAKQQGRTVQRLKADLGSTYEPNSGLGGRAAELSGQALDTLSGFANSAADTGALGVPGAGTVIAAGAGEQNQFRQREERHPVAATLGALAGSMTPQNIVGRIGQGVGALYGKLVPAGEGLLGVAGRTAGSAIVGAAGNELQGLGQDAASKIAFPEETLDDKRHLQRIAEGAALGAGTNLVGEGAQAISDATRAAHPEIAGAEKGGVRSGITGMQAGENSPARRLEELRHATGDETLAQTAVKQAAPKIANAASAHNEGVLKQSRAETAAAYERLNTSGEAPERATIPPRPIEQSGVNQFERDISQHGESQARLQNLQREVTGEEPPIARSEIVEPTYGSPAPGQSGLHRDDLAAVRQTLGIDPTDDLVRDLAGDHPAFAGPQNSAPGQIARELPGNKIHVNYYPPHPDGTPGNLEVNLRDKRFGLTVISRRLYRDGPDLVASHDTQMLPYHLQNQGIAKDIMRRQLGAYERLGVKRIEIPTAVETGRYVWPRIGFDTTDPAELLNVQESFSRYLNRRGIDPRTVPMGSLPEISQYRGLPGAPIEASGKDFLLGSDAPGAILNLRNDLSGPGGATLRDWASFSSQASKSASRSAANESSFGAGMPQGSPSGDGGHPVTVSTEPVVKELVDMITSKHVAQQTGDQIPGLQSDADLQAVLRKAVRAKVTSLDDASKLVARDGGYIVPIDVAQKAGLVSGGEPGQVVHLRAVDLTAPEFDTMTQALQERANLNSQTKQPDKRYASLAATATEARGGFPGLNELNAKQSKRFTENQRMNEGAGLRMVDKQTLPHEKMPHDQQVALDNVLENYKRRGRSAGQTRADPHVAKIAELGGVTKDLENIPMARDVDELRRSMTIGSIPGSKSGVVARMARAGLVRANPTIRALGSVPDPATELKAIGQAISPKLKEILVRMRSEAKPSLGVGALSSKFGLRGGLAGQRLGAAKQKHNELTREDLTNLLLLKQSSATQE